MKDTIAISLKKGILTPSIDRITVRSMQGMIAVVIGTAGIVLDTSSAHGAGFALIKLANESLPGDLVVIKVNGIDIEMLAPQAKQVGAALLRKADAADDWQLENPKMRIAT